MLDQAQVVIAKLEKGPEIVSKKSEGNNYILEFKDYKDAQQAYQKVGPQLDRVTVSHSGNNLYITFRFTNKINSKRCFRF